MKKLCLVSISHEKSIVFRAFSSPGGGSCKHSDMFSRARDIIFDVYKVFEILKFPESIFSKGEEPIMLRFPCTKQRRPLISVCIGFLLKIALRTAFEKAV